MGTQAQEVAAPPLPPPWRKLADYRRALPVCRTCAVEHKLSNLAPFPNAIACQVEKCEHQAAYYAIL